VAKGTSSAVTLNGNAGINYLTFMYPGIIGMSILSGLTTNRNKDDESRSEQEIKPYWYPYSRYNAMKS